MKKRWIVAAILGLLAVAFTVALKLVDVKMIPETMTEVGFATTNTTVFNSIKEGSSSDAIENWRTVSNIMVAAIVVAGVLFVGLGFVQLFKRKSFKKIDWQIKMLGLTYIAMLVVYVVFEKLYIVNYRPILIEGNVESSFPSSHTLFAVTIALTVMMILPTYIKSKAICVVMSLVLAAMAFAVANGRIAGCMHWSTDVIGGALYGAFLASIYYCLMKLKSGKETENE